MKFITYIRCFALFLPAFSLSASILGVFIHLRLELIALMLRESIKINLNILNLLVLSVVYLPVAYISNDDLSDLLKFLLLPISYIYIILLISNNSLMKFIKNNYFQVAFKLNLVYCVYQYFVYYIGFSEYAMVHSNLPGQAEYIIPHDNFLRISGLFNENSQFAFFLSIAFVYFKKINSKLSYLTLLILILTGSKFALLFLTLYLISRNWISLLLAAITFLTLIPTVLLNFDLQEVLLLLGFSPIDERLGLFVNSTETLTFLGNGKLYGWDIFSYHLNGYGLLFGIAILLIHAKILLNSSISKDLIIIFIVSFTSHGALSILPHSLLLLTALVTKDHLQKSPIEGLVR
jgi:hypothetical protein